MTCDRCYQPLEVGEHGLYRCPLQPRRAPVVRPDDIPGGLDIYHGLCHPDGSPQRFYSHSAITKACQERGVMRWSDAYEESRVTPWQEYAEHRDHDRDRIEAHREKMADRARRGIREMGR